MDNDEDVRDDFTRTLEGGNWKDAFLKARTNDFKKGADAYVSDIFAGKAQPSDGLTGSAEAGDKFDYTDGDLADQFTQGLFGEEYLRKRFVDKELGKFKPMLEEKASTLEKRIKQKNAEDSSQNAQSTVYNDGKGGASHVSNSTFDDKDAWWNKKWGATPQEREAREVDAERRKQHAIADTEAKMQRDGYIDLLDDSPNGNRRNQQYVQYLLGFSVECKFDEGVKNALKVALGKKNMRFDDDTWRLSPENLKALTQQRKTMEADFGDVEKNGEAIDVASKVMEAVLSAGNSEAAEVVFSWLAGEASSLIKPKDYGWVE